VNTLTNSQNQTQASKPNVLSNLDKRVADGAAAEKTASQAQPEMAVPAAAPSGPAQQGDNSSAKQ
jgi:hypothetical protein